MSTWRLAYRCTNEGKSFHDAWDPKPLWNRILRKHEPLDPVSTDPTWDPSGQKSQRESVRKIAEWLCTMPPGLFWQILDGASIGPVL